MMELQHEPMPHPYLQGSLLYISNLAQHVSDSELAQAFEHCVPFRPQIIRDGSERPLTGTIEFKHPEKAEKALTTLQGRQVPGVIPPALIRLSPFPPDQANVLPQPSAAPRIVKQLPSGFTDSELYDLFRPFGPLASVRTQTLIGPDTGILEYWREEDAKVAEENMHCAEVGDQNIAVQVYHARRGAGLGSEFSPSAPAFVPSGLYPQQTGGSYSPPYSQSSPRRTSNAFVHGPGQMVQFAPLSGPGSGSHSGLIDPCNLFVKNLDEKIDSKTLFQHFATFGQIVSARVMRDESGRSRGFGFVSFQTPDQASTAMHSMNGVVLGSKQIVVRLHEPKHLRQEKLAQRFAGGHNNHPRSRSGATSPTASEGGESLSGFPSPRGSYMGLASPSAYSSSLALTSERARRSSGSYYNAALAGHLNIPMTLEDLSALTPVVRKEVLTGELQRRVRGMNEVPAFDVDAIVNSLVGLSLTDVVTAIQDPTRLSEAVQETQAGLRKAQEYPIKSKERSKSPSPAASADSRLLDPGVLAATASAPDHPSTPVSLSTPLSTPPRMSSPAAAAIPGGGASDRDRLSAAVAKLEPDSEHAAAITELLMSLTKRERALCLFNGEVLRGKVADARAVLDSDDTEDVASAFAPAPVTPARKTTATSLDESPHTPALSSRGPSAAASPAAPVTPPSKSATTQLAESFTLVKLAQMPAAKVIEIVQDTATVDALGLRKADPMITKATDEFIDSLSDLAISKQKQQLGDKLFRVVKNFGIKSAPKVTIALLDQEELRPLAHIMNSYPTVLKEKAVLVQAAIAANK